MASEPTKNHLALQGDFLLLKIGEGTGIGRFCLEII